jgi:hypothetical protein
MKVKQIQMKLKNNRKFKNNKIKKFIIQGHKIKTKINVK